MSVRAKRTRRPIPNARLVVLVVAVVFLGCSSQPKPSSQDSRGDATLSNTKMEALQALGYLSWDENADASLSGVTKYDREKSWSGYNLYTNDVNEAYVMDMSGERVHTWYLDSQFKHCEHFELLENGDIIIVCVHQMILRLDWDSKVLWSRRFMVHHDVAVLPDESLLVPVVEHPRGYKGHWVKFDNIVRLSSYGTYVNMWSTYQNLDSLKKYHGPSEIDADDSKKEKSSKVLDYYHLNTIEVLPETPLGEEDPRFMAGNYLLCLRNANLIAILDRDTREVVWHWGPGHLDLPHMPTMLESGNILVFDNGTSRNYSRVVELNPRSGEIVWEYRASPPQNFWSKWRGSNQRLPNGNTLICESERGHVFEVTRSGEVVWDFWNPELRQGKRKRIYRLMRVPRQSIDKLLARSKK